MGRLKKIIDNPTKLLFGICFYLPAIGHLIPDSLYLKLQYKSVFNKKLDLNDPKTFNEKLQWLKIYDRCPIYTTMVDKYEAKKYVAKVIGSQYIIPTLGVWDHFDDIDFSVLPNQFVLKCTHDSGGLVICKNKECFNKEAAHSKIEKCLNKNFYYMGREWPYKDVKPRIIAEQYMKNSNAVDELSDYKLMCFNGKLKCSFTGTDRYSKSGLKITFYDAKWNKLSFERHYPSEKIGMTKPRTYEEMVFLAEKLSEKIPFARIDFYEIDGKIYFGEITLYPGSGLEEFKPASWDKTLGDWIQLPENLRRGNN